MATKVTGILGKKVGMTQLFDSKGDVRPVTVLQAGPCVVTQHKSAAKDGYEAAQIGLVEFVKESRLTKPAKGHLAKNNLPPVKFMREVPLEVEPSADGADGSAVKVGDRVGSWWVINEGLAPGEEVVSDGTSKVRDGMLVTPAVETPGPEGSR